ncbi:hypothetical protein XENOCAPTIV_012739, partial [Xenoophorus captivus]
IAAQVGHAAVGLYQALQEKNSWREMAWKAKKVVLQGTNVAHLLELQALALSLNLPTYLVQDAGLTQVGVHIQRTLCSSANPTGTLLSRSFPSCGTSGRAAQTAYPCTAAWETPWLDCVSVSLRPVVVTGEEGDGRFAECKDPTQNRSPVSHTAVYTP